MTSQKARHSAPEAMLRIGATMGVPKVLQDMGLDPSEVLLAGGFDPELFDNADNVTSATARGRLLAHCAAKSECEHFGLLAGAQIGLQSLGLVGLLMKYSPDVETALGNLVRYFHLHAHGVVLSLQVQGSTARMAYQIKHRIPRGSNHVYDGAIAVLFNILRELCGKDWKATEFWSTHTEPEDTKPFRQFFGVRPHFNAEQNALVFNASWLTHSLQQVDAGVHELIQQQMDALAAQHSDNFPEQIRTVLYTAVLSGHANANQIASLFSMHPRTLHRRLQPYGIGYQQLLDETCFELAQQMLIDSNHQVSEIALILHYADARSFIRAFRRWSGITPARWRATQKQLRRTVTEQAR